MKGIDLEMFRNESEKKGKKFPTGLFWTPPEGNSQVRIVPYVHNPGNPFTALQIYFKLIPNSNAPVLSPKTYGEKDLIFDFAMECKESKDPKKVELAKKLFPATKVYAPVIVRGREGEGIKFWSMSKTNYEDLKNLIINGGAGDIADLNNGRDVLINHTKIHGKSSGTIRVVTHPESSVATQDKELLEAIKNVPVISEMYERQSPERLRELLQEKVKQEFQREEVKPVQTTPVGNYDLDSLLSNF